MARNVGLLFRNNSISKRKSKRKTKQRESFDYDAALSFSGKDRKLAGSIAREAKRLGLRIFYDRDNKAFMWGKSERVYHDVYGRQSRTVVPIVSMNYLDCEIARFEYDIAKQEAPNRDHEYILPVRCDGSLLPGLVGTTCYLSAEEHNARQIALLLKEKLSQLLDRDQANCNEPLALQHADERLALGLLVTAAYPRQQLYYEQLFPDLKWNRLLKSLEASGLIAIRDDIPEVNDVARRAIPETSDEYGMLVNRWIETLEPISHFIDIAPALALHYAGTDRVEESALLLAEVATGVDLGWWNSIYLNALETLVAKKLSALGTETKLAVLNGLGICLTHETRYNDALKQYESLRKLARKHESVYWVGQALINSGVAWFHKGDRDRAIRSYQAAEDHGEKTRDWRLVGRALGNLAESIRETDVGGARALLAESVKVKRRAKDEEGLIASFMQQGNLEAEEGNPAEALEYYSKCEKACRKSGELYLQSLALHNLGKANAELGRRKTAIRYYTRSLEIADESGFDYPLVLSSLGIGVCLFEQERYDEARGVFVHLLQDANRLSDIENQICSLHAIAVATSILDGPKTAAPAFSKALRFAKKHVLGHWYARVVADKSRGLKNGKLAEASLDAIQKAARQRERAGDHELALYLWHHLAGILQSNQSEDDEVNSAYANVLALLSRLDANDTDHLTMMFEYADWQWARGRFNESLQTLERAERVAKDNRLPSDQAIAADKRGVYHQHLDQQKLAIRCHKRAAKIARRSDLNNLLEILLNNLGEAHRHLEQWEEANRAFLEAEELAGQHDEESAISTAHNRGLVAQDQGNFDLAASIFNECKLRSKRGGYAVEQVRAWEALANLSLVQGQQALSLQRYRKAMELAKANRVLPQVSRTALNYASLLRHLGKPNDAIRVLRPYSSHIAMDHHSHSIQRTLGQSLHEAGKLAKAIEVLRVAVQLAEQIGDIESLLVSSSALAEALEDSERFAESSKVLLKVVHLEKHPELWVALMNQLLRVQLAADMETCQETFDQASALAAKRGLEAGLAELHMTVGAHKWIHEGESKFEALKAMAVACAHALIHDVNFGGSEEDATASEDSLVGDVVGHSLMLLTDPSTATDQEELESLTRELSDWVKSTFTDLEMASFMTSPVRMAVKLLPYNKKPRKMMNVLDQLIADEFEPDGDGK